MSMADSVGHDRSLLPAPAAPGGAAGVARRRPQRKAKDEELEARLQNALIIEAQKEAAREREKRIAQERDKKIEKRMLPAQARQCISQLSVWDSEAHPIVTRMLTQSELASRTQSYEGLVLMEGKPRRQGLIVSAIRSGSLELVQAVLKELGSCTGVYDTDNFNSPLHYAAVVSGSGDIVRALMDAGHKNKAHNRFGWTPLDFARYCGNDIAAEILQEKAGASRFAANVGMESAAVDEHVRDTNLVLTAVRARQTDMIKFIVPRVPDAGRCADTQSGNTALHYAVLLEDSPFVVLLLLQANADLDHRNIQGRTAANVAQVKGRDKSAALIQRWRVADRKEREEIAAEISDEVVMMMRAAEKVMSLPFITGHPLSTGESVMFMFIRAAECFMSPGALPPFATCRPLCQHRGGALILSSRLLRSRRACTRSTRARTSTSGTSSRKTRGRRAGGGSQRRRGTRRMRRGSGSRRGRPAEAG